MPERRSNAKPTPARAGRVKADSRASGGAPAPALRRPDRDGTIEITRAPLDSTHPVGTALRDLVEELCI